VELRYSNNLVFIAKGNADVEKRREEREELGSQV